MPVITDEARRWAGREYPVREIEVTVRDIQKFAYATGETDPVHFDVEAARAAGYRNVVAPPLFYYVLRVEPFHRRPVSELEPDGSPSEDVPPMEATRGMAGETSLQLPEDICAGDTISVHKRLVDIYEKEGRSGPLVFLQFEYRFVNQEGKTVVVEQFTRIFR
jgi:hydroxyacyl-ACP dehydratase HTD2-like protein with hotdog domain